MKIKKNYENGLCLTLTNQKGDILKIYYQDDNLCFENTNYKSNNSFYILRQEPLYEKMKLLFKKIKKYDRFCYLNSRNINTKFEWVSEDTDITIPNHLTIYETNDGYRMNLTKNRSDNKRECVVKFSLSKSRQPQITEAFDEFMTSNFNDQILYSTKELKKK